MVSLQFILAVSIFLVVFVNSKQGLNYNLIEKQDKNKDGKLSKAQFIEGLKIAFTKSGVEKNEEMIQDFADQYIRKMKFKELIELSDIKTKIESDELLRAFQSWRDEMWKERISRDGKHDGNNPKFFKNPELYGYKYKRQKAPQGKRPEL